MKIQTLLFALTGLMSIFTQASAYELTINNQAVVFTFINKTCNGGTIKNPPDTLIIGQTDLEVQNDALQGCMLRYDDGRGSILGIWIHQGQVDCSNQGGIFSYNCSFRNNILKIN